MKKRVSIYIEEDSWELAKSIARKRSVYFDEGLSTSRVVEAAIRRMDANGSDEVKDKCWYCEKVHDLRVACPEYIAKSKKQEKAKLHDKNKATLSKIKDVVTEIHQGRVAEYPETVEDKVVGYVEEAAKVDKSVFDDLKNRVTVSNFIKERDDQFHVKTKKGSVKANAALDNFFKPQPKIKDKKGAK